MTQPPAAPPPPAFPLPTVSPVERVRRAYVDRSNTDYVFESPGMVIFLTIITCQIYGLYAFYQLMRRMREHNRRRLELLEGAAELAWQQAGERGVAEELRPNFERVAGHLAALRRLTTEFREPAAWLAIVIGAWVVTSGLLGFVPWMIAVVLLDGDLVDHDSNEGAVEAELTYIYGRLGYQLAAPDPGRVKARHNYAGRIVATIFTCGIYGFWWLYNLMVDGNRHFGHNWPWEDALAGAVQQTAPAG